MLIEEKYGKNGGVKDWFWKLVKRIKLHIIGFLTKKRKTRRFSESLKPDYRKWNKMGYKVCVFLSGKEDIVELTKELLIHNKQILAEKNVKKAKERER